MSSSYFLLMFGVCHTGLVWTSVLTIAIVWKRGSMTIRKTSPPSVADRPPDKHCGCYLRAGEFGSIDYRPSSRVIGTSRLAFVHCGEVSWMPADVEQHIASLSPIRAQGRRAPKFRWVADMRLKSMAKQMDLTTKIKSPLLFWIISYE